MNNCSPISLSFSKGIFETNTCVFRQVDNASYTTQYYYQLDKLVYNVNDNLNRHTMRICKYDTDYNFISSYAIRSDNLTLGEHTYNLDSDYLYRLSYTDVGFDSVYGLRCNASLGSMSKDLAFGSGNSLFTNLSDIGPFFVIIIAFALGFWFLKKIIRKGQKGKTL